MGSRRYQFMVRDSKKYADTHGWGFAIFDIWGKVFEAQDIGGLGPLGKNRNLTDPSFCVPCHENAKDRNYVFSRLPAFDPKGIQRWVGQNAFRVLEHNYIDKNVTELPKDVQKLIPKKYKTVRFLDGPSRKYLYNGIIYETRSVLIKEATRSNEPAILLSTEGKRLSLVVPAEARNEPTALPCGKTERLFASYWTLGTNPDDWVSKDLFCSKKAD